ncbi:MULTISPECIES: type I-F CRISPR-associated protein Csy1 [unclassified Neptuniibacter]|uniref:type I-F CRISPR-associated protein Csy1 n=1 Tax=unclassified Neptuniibacter TaxID=2630693 RepID=UPI0025D88E92|nr:MULTISPECIES: type I-F CRISPR-associated protein Csy1 [unclassified Neptuniibacter]|tara:strand:- start:416 stop:1717 length:1302 start_codon:yes stop_codon:yes gene_type:complete
MTEAHGNREGELRKLMRGFIQERFLTKTEKLAPDDPKYLKLQEQFQYDSWLADAARRVGQLQVVTHSLKAIHPDAKGTNLYCPAEQLPKFDLVSSACLGAEFERDVVGNAAALDVYKFLRLTYKERPLLELALAQTPDFIAALSDDKKEGQLLCEAFAGITQAKGDLSSHTRAKQLYWWIGSDPRANENYHLLSPLYATSLAHRIYQTLNADRFSEQAKEARKAAREDSFSEQGYRVYPDLAVQKLGGTKPQNISQLNSERGGTNYLLASLPPSWRSAEVSPLLNIDTAYWRFTKRPAVTKSIRGLVGFLKENPPKNVHTRNEVDEYVAVLLDELVMFTSEIRKLTPGWSANPDCRLPEYQKHWLDPYHYDESLKNSVPALTTWSEAVIEAFAGWLNFKMRRADLSVGSADYQDWFVRLHKKLALLQEELPYV